MILAQMIPTLGLPELLAMLHVGFGKSPTHNFVFCH